MFVCFPRDEVRGLLRSAKGNEKSNQPKQNTKQNSTYNFIAYTMYDLVKTGLSEMEPKAQSALSVINQSQGKTGLVCPSFHCIVSNRVSSVTQSKLKKAPILLVTIHEVIKTVELYCRLALLETIIR